MTIGVPPDLQPMTVRGNALDLLRELPDRSVHVVCTSPPYWGLRDYSACHCAQRLQASEALRDAGGNVTEGNSGTWVRCDPKPDCPDCNGTGHLGGFESMVWGGDPAHLHDWSATAPRRARGTDDGGAGSISQSSVGANYEARGGEVCSCGAWRGQLGLETTPQEFVAHMVLLFQEVKRVLRDDGTLWLNLGDTYATHPAGVTGKARWATSTLNGNRHQVGAEQAGSIDRRGSGLKPKDMAGIPWRVAFALQEDGWYLRSDCIWAKTNAMPEPARDRPKRAHEYVFLLTKRPRYFYDGDAVRIPAAEASIRRIESALRSTKGPEGLKAEAGHQAAYDVLMGGSRRKAEDGTAALTNLGTFWPIPSAKRPEAHFATFPEEIPRIAILAGTSAGGCCQSCGAPFRHVVVASGGTIGTEDAGWDNVTGKLRQNRGRPPVPAVAFEGTYARHDLGYVPSCGCRETGPPVPAVVLDPFCGSGTVMDVARRLGRRSIGLEANPAYIRIATERSQSNVPDIEQWRDQREEAGA